MKGWAGIGVKMEWQIVALEAAMKRGPIEDPCIGFVPT